MQDLNKIENEYLQANDVGDDTPTGLTREFAEKFREELLHKINRVVRDHVDNTGMDEYLDKFQIAEFVYHIHGGVQDACGDMPIWGIVKRGEA